MYRPQQNESRLMESGYHEEIPFFREAITLIDECTKLMKEDRILLRNKIKDYLKDLRENKQIENEWENEQIQTLIQIFVETNKKKSLAKIQRGDKVMDWMQIKLRKFIDNNKREKHKKEVESFHRAKFINVKKPVQYYRGDKNSSLSKEPLPFKAKVNEGNVPNTQFGLKRFMQAANVQSLSKSRQKSPSQSRKINPHNQSYSQSSYRKNFPFLRKNKQNEGIEPIKSIKATLDIHSTSKQPVKRPTSAKSHSLNKSFEHFNNIKKAWNNTKVNVTQIEKGSKEKPIKQDFYREKPISSQSSQSTSHDINKLTQLFTQQLNQQAKRKSPEIIFSNPQPQVQKSINQSILWPKSFIPSDSATGTDREKEGLNNSVSRYEASSKKIQEMLEHSKNMLNNFGAKQDEISTTIPAISLSNYSQNFNEDKNKKDANPQHTEDLFTPPDFLAQCRKFLFSSSKKPQEQIEHSQQIDDNRDSTKKLTFTNIISESKEKSIQKHSKFSHLGINEVFSENASANISTKKPSSQVHFQFKNISIRNVEELLLQIFREGYRVTMDCYQIGQIMSKSENECQRLLQQYCDFLNNNPVNDNNRLTFDFVSTVKQFYTYGRILHDSQDYFCNFLSSILDIKKRGFVNIEDIDCFLESLESSEIEATSMDQIHRSLEEVFRKCCQIEGGGNLMTRWSLYYLELTQDEDFQLLHEHLSKFEFQFDQQE